MSIKETLIKIKTFWDLESDRKEKIFTIAIIFLVGSASFGLGRLSAFESQEKPISIKNSDLEANIIQTDLESRVLGSGQENEAKLKPGGEIVASKNSDKYHFPWCSGAKRMKEENKIYFSSIEEARNAGYLPAGNCKGLE